MYLSRREITSYSFLAVFTCLWAGAFSLLGMDLHHDGVMFKAAVDVAEGKWVFKETFCQYGILSPLLQGWMLKIFGTELAVLKLGTAFFYAGIVILNDLIWRRFLTLPFRIFTGVMFFVLAPYLMVPFHIWSSVYALFFMLLAAEFVLLAEEKEKKVFLYLSGICAGLVFGFRWPCGVVTLGAQLLSLAVAGFCRKEGRKYLKNTTVLLGGFGTVTALYALYLTLGNAWRDCFQQIFSFVSKFAWERGGSGSAFQFLETFLPHSETTNFIFAFIPLAVLGLLLFAGRKIFSASGETVRELPLITVLIFGLAAYHQYYPVPCVRHLYWGSVPMMGAYVLLIQRIFVSARLPRFRKGLYLFFLILPLIWGGFWRMYAGLFRVSEFFRRQTSDFPGLRYIRHGRSEMQICNIAWDIKQNLPPHLKERGVFNYTADGVWSVVLPPCKDFQHPMFVNWLQNVYADYPGRAMAYVEAKRPVVLASTAFFHPVYVKVAEFQHMGVVYSLFLPRQ